MPEKPKDVYGSFGSVPTEVAASQAQPSLNVNANPNAFGAQQGEAIQDFAKGANEIVQKYQGQINETLYTDAESKYVAELGALTGQYKSLEGLDAVNALPGYTASVNGLRQKYRADLPPAAARSFDLLALRHEGFSVGDANTYAAAQVRDADYRSSATAIAMSTTQAANPAVAVDDTQFGTVLGDIKAHAGRMYSNSPGIDVDPATGKASFADTPEGAATKEAYTNEVYQQTTQAWVNRFTPLMNADLGAAYIKYQAERDNIPPAAQVALDSQFAPRIVQSQAHTDYSTALGSATLKYRQSTATPKLVAENYGPSSASSNPNNMGNVKTPEAAAAGTAGFVQPKTPVDGVALAANTLRKGYQGMTLSQIGAKWAPSSENNTSNWVNNVSKISGISPDETPNLNDPTVLAKVLSGISGAEKSPHDRALFTEDVIKQGAQASISGKDPETHEAFGPENQNAAGLPTNVVPPPSVADYYRTNYAKILDDAAGQAEARHPGNIKYAELVRTKTEQHMNDIIKQQEMAYKADSDMVMQAANGTMTNGVRPTTIDQLGDVNPQIKDALDRMMINNPQSYSLLENRLLTLNAKNGGADMQKYGTPILRIQHDIVAGKITNSSQLLDYLPPDEHTKGDYLTVEGFSKATEMLNKMETNSDEVKIQASAFEAIKEQYSVYGKNTMDENDPKGTVAYNNALPLMYKAWEEGRAKGYTTSEMANPDNPHWVGLATKAMWLTNTQKAINAISQGVKPLDVQQSAEAKALTDKVLHPEVSEEDPNRLYVMWKNEKSPEKKEAIKAKIMKLKNLMSSAVDTTPSVPVSE